MLGFDMGDRDPAVMLLDVELEYHHTVYFEEGQADDAENQERRSTIFTA